MYFIETDTPISKFTKLSPPPKTYLNKEGIEKGVKNYNLSNRAQKLYESSKNKDGLVINVSSGLRVVYSGKTKNLSSRLREHAFGHPGTAALALVNYPELKRYQWYYYFLESAKYKHREEKDEILLKLGEQIWRAKYGWPILSSG